MTDLALIRQQKQPGRARGRPFAKGASGNPLGRPRGCRDKPNRAAELLLDGEAEALTRKAVELALAGDAAALRLCLDRIVAPRRERAGELAMPPIRGPADVAGAMGAIVDAAARGLITLGEAAQLAQLIETVIEAIGTTDFDRRLQLLEAMPARAH